MGEVRTSLGDLTDSLSHFTSSMRGMGCYELVRVIVRSADEEEEEEDILEGVAGGVVKVGGEGNMGRNSDPSASVPLRGLEVILEEKRWTRLYVGGGVRGGGGGDDILGSL